MTNQHGQHAERDPLRGVLLMVTAAVCFSTMGACLKAALTQIPFYEAVFFRSIVSVLVIGAMLRRRRIPFRGSNQRMLFSRSFFGFLAMNCGFYALGRIQLADASLLHHTSPLFVALFSVLFLGERVTRGLVLLLTAAFVGVVLVIQPTFDIINLPGLIGLLGGALAGIAYVHVRHLHRTDHTWVIAFHFTSFSAFIALPIMLIIGFVVPSPVNLALLLAAGLCGTGGQLLMTAAYRYDDASRLAPYGYASILLAVLLGLGLFDEVPGPWSLLGMTIVTASGIGIYRLRRPNKIADKQLPEPPGTP